MRETDFSFVKNMIKRRINKTQHLLVYFDCKNKKERNFLPSLFGTLPNTWTS